MSMVTRREFLQYAAVAPAAPAEWRNRQSGMACRRRGWTNCMIMDAGLVRDNLPPAGNQRTG